MKYFWKFIDWLLKFDDEFTDFDYDEELVQQVHEPDDN